MFEKHLQQHVLFEPACSVLEVNGLSLPRPDSAE